MEKQMDAQSDARVMAILLALAQDAVSEKQAAMLYNEITRHILAVPAEYQVAMAMQTIADSGLPLTGAAAERFATAVLYCVCWEDESGRPGYESITLARVETYREAFRPFFDNAEALLNALVDALQDSAASTVS